jgi:predicted nuclease with TOPRIM domain
MLSNKQQATIQSLIDLIEEYLTDCVNDERMSTLKRIEELKTFWDRIDELKERFQLEDIEEIENVKDILEYWQNQTMYSYDAGNKTLRCFCNTDHTPIILLIGKVKH